MNTSAYFHGGTVRMAFDRIGSLGCLVCGVLVTFSGCSTLSNTNTKTASNGNMPSGQFAGQQRAAEPQFAGSPLAENQYAAQSNSAPANVVPTHVSADVIDHSTSIAQVGHQADLARFRRLPSNCGCGSCQTGQSAAGSCLPGAGDCMTGNCPTGQCQTGACQPQHPGFMPPPNLYGIDGQEFLCNGGDQRPDVAIRRDDSMVGLDAMDTVVNYTTEAGDVEINASNKVCVYAPRFASVRKMTGAVSGNRAIGLKGIDRPVGPGDLALSEGGVVVRDALELGHADVARRIDAMRDRNRGVPVENVQQVVLTGEVQAALAGLSIMELDLMQDEQKANLEKAAHFAVAWTLDENVEVQIADLAPPTIVRSQSVEAFTVYDFPDEGRLKIVKLADRQHAQPGEIVEFAIRVDNVGDSAVNDVVVSDNLTTRLEFVEGSEQSTVDASFSAAPNDELSLKLTWKLDEELKVGESATVRFRCRVR